MQVTFASPVTTQAASTATTAPGTLGSVAPAFSGATNPFDILMQQLMSMSVTTEGQSTDGSALTFQMPTLTTTNGEPLVDSTQLASMDSAQFMAYLQQLNLSQQTTLEVPAIVQELQQAFAEATQLGQGGESSLSSILSSMTQSDAASLTQYLQSAQQTPGTQGMMDQLQQVLSTMTTDESSLTTEQKTMLDSLKEQLQTIVQTTQQQGVTAQTAATQQSATAQTTVATSQGTAAQAIDAALKNYMAGRGGEVRVTPATEQDATAESQVLMQETMPEYLTPSYLLQQGLTAVQVEQSVQTVQDPQTSTQQSVQEMFIRERLGILTTDGSQNAMSADVQGGMDMRNSLNLTKEGQTATASVTNAPDTVTTETAKTVTSFDDRLQRMQETDAIVKQVSRQLSAHQGLKTNEVSIKLEPDHLGSMQIKVNGSGEAMTAQIVVSNPQVKELLDEDIGSLKLSLEQAQVKVDKVDITVDEASTGSGDQSGSGMFGQSAQGFERGAAQQENVQASFQEMLYGVTPTTADGEEAVASLSEKLYAVNFLA